MNFEQELATQTETFEANGPAGAAAFINAKIEELTASFSFDGVPGMGDPVPEFTLPDAWGQPVSLLEHLAGGPVVLTFYRGAWCPYCNIQLAAYQRMLPEIVAAGGRLIAISPQKPDGSLTITEKHALTFDVLSDAGNTVARHFGLVYTLQPDFRAALASFGIDFNAINGDDSGELPITATFVIGRDGRVILTYAETDFRKRLNPKIIIEALESANSSAA